MKWLLWGMRYCIMQKFLSLKIALVILFCGLIAPSIPEHLHVVTSASIDHRIFYKGDGFITAKDGDYVTFTMKSPLIEHGKPVNVTKKVACRGGDVLSVTDNKEYLCNKAFLKRAIDQTPSGVPLSNFKFTGVIPEGKYFVMGTDRNSFDSRYYGLVDKSDILRKDYPIF